eukprot:GFUD01023739.1.p1 GENE.GFUD01023739.1~~GFUD01023739.1.p1  ORF type:complete len:100 (+),score=0.32 GFUD01023739.1:109-408(+)
MYKQWSLKNRDSEPLSSYLRLFDPVTSVNHVEEILILTISVVPIATRSDVSREVIEKEATISVVTTAIRWDDGRRGILKKRLRFQFPHSYQIGCGWRGY